MDMFRSIAKFPEVFSATSHKKQTSAIGGLSDDIDNEAPLTWRNKPPDAINEANGYGIYLDLDRDDHRSIDNLDTTMINLDTHQSKKNEHNTATAQPFRVGLTKEKTLIQDALSSTDMTYFNISSIYGMCAFLLIEDMSGGNQYLLLKRLEDKHQSNHSILAKYLRLNKLGYGLDNPNILCGGEIVIENGVLKNWNLKSGGFSVGSDYDEDKIKELGYDHSAAQSLWLPKNCFSLIESYPKNYYEETFEANGALKPNQKKHEWASNCSQKKPSHFFYKDRSFDSTQSAQLTELTMSISDNSLSIPSTSSENWLISALP